MARLVFDLESDGFLHQANQIHCLALLDLDKGGEPELYVGMAEVRSALARLEAADELIAHNGLAFDVPMLKKLFPEFDPRARNVDTLVLSRLIYTDMKDRDFAASRPRAFYENRLFGKHSLEAWGWRLGNYKGDFKPDAYTNEETGEPHTWQTIPYSDDMGEYCRQDVAVTAQLYEKFLGLDYSKHAIELEHDVQAVVAKMMAHGFRFDEEAAGRLHGELLGEKAEIEQALVETFGSWWVPSAERAYKRKAKRFIENPHGAHRKFVTKNLGDAGKQKVEVRGFYQYGEADVPFTPIELVQFNPGSRDHIADRLIKVHGWKPREFTETGKPKVDEKTLEGLEWPEARLCHEYLTVCKKLGQLADGDNAWLRLVRDGRIYGAVNSNGTRTGRMTHFAPNVAQVDKDKRMRALFTADDGWVLVGCDADGLELRMLGHFLARFDGGAYARTVVEGNKDDGTDVHTQNQKAVGLNSRDSAKTFIYALIYGGGDEKIGTILYGDWPEEKRRRFIRTYRSRAGRKKQLRKLGAMARERMYSRFPALRKLVAQVQKKNREAGFLKGLDGRLLLGSSDHAALNTVLQSAGALVMKEAIRRFDQYMAEHGYAWGRDFAVVALVHDELQITCRPEIQDHVGQLCSQAIADAGPALDLRCPLAANYDVGPDWSHTH